MTINKKLWGTLSAAIALCAVTALNFSVIPNVLAAAPESTPVKTVTASSLPSPEPTEEEAPFINEADSFLILKPEEMPDSNAISKEKAIEIALAHLADLYESGATTWPAEAHYIGGSAPNSNPVWFVSVSPPTDFPFAYFEPGFLERTRYAYEVKGLPFLSYVYDVDHTTEDYIIYVNRIIVEINAFSGEFVSVAKSASLMEQGSIDALPEQED